MTTTTTDPESKLLQLISTLKMLANTAATREDDAVDNNDIATIADLAHELAEQAYEGYTAMVFQLRNA